ncbi:MAG TPA: amidohydrolase family protein, partial [Phycisphaerales bacterium]|nr:amidohydrolase family protein [Phycisphaerales bacterium]
MTDSPTASTLIIRNARLVSPAGGPGTVVRGEPLGELEITERADVTVSAGRITKVTARKTGAVTRKAETAPPGATEIDAAGRVLMPGFVDCHTHACWAGSRLDEWDQKRRGVPYLKILQNGGGIMATVRAVRDIPFSDLVDQLVERASRMLALGSTTIEVKSGYGLNTEAELKMLRAVREAQSKTPATLVPTALLGHAIDESQPGFVGKVIRET